ncbi:hypothetical protein AKJ51_01040 [candidate division MSBL1 archaeon SCGC-AAA382A20]|uniref:Uncharacterized protein n=1 Tax=candidate division MSBL1 archaeon SCGC-AAA382A20 TaxID=1698280 RepID=A0A133VM76_9EURY|nr:hypothetical protein AKJ51_01040 [candidate division MSBL1 archaeon SCGC-AAA382A20]
MGFEEDWVGESSYESGGGRKFQKWCLEETKEFFKDHSSDIDVLPEKDFQDELAFLQNALSAAFPVMKGILDFNKLPFSKKTWEKAKIENSVVQGGKRGDYQYELVSGANIEDFKTLIPKNAISHSPLYENIYNITEEGIEIGKSSNKQCYHFFLLGVFLTAKAKGVKNSPMASGRKLPMCQPDVFLFPSLKESSVMGANEDSGRVIDNMIDNLQDELYPVIKRIGANKEPKGWYLFLQRELERYFSPSGGTHQETEAKNVDKKETPEWVKPVLTDSILRLAWELHKHQEGLKPGQLKKEMEKRLDRTEGKGILTDKARRGFWSEPSKCTGSA